MTDFSNFTTLLRQSMPYLSPGQAAAIANSPVSAGSSLTWGQLFSATMENSAHVTGAGNIYYSATVTLNGAPTEAAVAANQLADISRGRFVTLGQTAVGAAVESVPFSSYAGALDAALSNAGAANNTGFSPIDSMKNAFMRGASERFSAAGTGPALFLGDLVDPNSAFFRNEMPFAKTSIMGINPEELRGLSAEEATARMGAVTGQTNWDNVKSGLSALDNGRGPDGNFRLSNVSLEDYARLGESLSRPAQSGTPNFANSGMRMFVEGAIDTAKVRLPPSVFENSNVGDLIEFSNRMAAAKVTGASVQFGGIEFTPWDVKGFEATRVNIEMGKSFLMDGIVSYMGTTDPSLFANWSPAQFEQLGRYLKWAGYAGYAALAVDAGFTGYRIFNALDQGQTDVAVREGATFFGRVGGAYAGFQVLAPWGIALGPWGVIGFGVGGAAIGAIAGDRGVGFVVDMIQHPEETLASLRAAFDVTPAINALKTGNVAFDPAGGIMVTGPSDQAVLQDKLPDGSTRQFNVIPFKGWQSVTTNPDGSVAIEDSRGTKIQFPALTGVTVERNSNDLPVVQVAGNSPETTRNIAVDPQNGEVDIWSGGTTPVETYNFPAGSQVAIDATSTVAVTLTDWHGNFVQQFKLLADQTKAVRDFDVNNLQNWTSREITYDADNTPTDVEIDLDPAVVNTGVSVLEAFGSALGRVIAGNNPLAQIAASTVVGGLSRQLSMLLGDDLKVNAAGEIDLDDAFSQFGINLAGAAISAGSSFLAAELSQALGLDGITARIFNVGVGTITGTVLNYALQNSVGIGSLVGTSLTNALSSALSANIGGLFGTMLANTIIPIQNQGGAIGSQIGSAIGSAIVANFFVGGATFLMGALSFGIGTFLGAALGTLIGNLFGGSAAPPTAQTQSAYEPHALNTHFVGRFKDDGGDTNISDKMMNAASDVFTGYVRLIGGDVLGSGFIDIGYRQSSWWLATQYDPAVPHTGRVFLSSQDAIEFGGLKLMKSAHMAGGDILMKRVLANTHVLDERNGYEQTRHGSVGWYEDGMDGKYLSTFNDELAIAFDYARYLHDRETINALIALNPGSAFAAGWAITLARANELGLTHLNVSDFYGGLSGYLSSLHLDALGASFSDVSMSLNAQNQLVLDIRLPDNAEVPGEFLAYADDVQDLQTGAGHTLRLAFDDYLRPYGFTTPASQANVGGVWQAQGVGNVNNVWIASNDMPNRYLAGSNSYNVLIGQGQADELHGANNSDWISGGGGNDFIDGGDGNDYIFGGAGYDQLQGGGGNDAYIFNRGDAVDVVYDHYIVAVTSTDWVDESHWENVDYDPGLIWVYTGHYETTTSYVHQNGGTDVLQLGTGITAGDVTLAMDGSNLVVAVRDPAAPVTSYGAIADKIVLQSWTDPLDRIETLRFADGSTINLAAVVNSATGAVTGVPNGAVLAGNTVAENAANGTTVGRVVGNDLDGHATLTYSLLSDASGRFALNATTGVLTVANGALLDYELAASYGISVRVSDQAGHNFDKTLTVNLTNVNEAPVNAALSGPSAVAENAANGTVVGTVAGTDPDAGATFSYALTDNAGGRFAVNATTGAVTVANGSLLNYEAATAHNITVRVTDQGGLTYDKVFTVNVTNVNEAPTNAALAGASVAENAANGTTVGTVSASDPDAGAAFIYALTDSAGGRFAINTTTGVITVADGTLLNYEAAASHNITVRVTDQGGLTFDKTFAITVADVNEAPSNATLSAALVAENAANGTVVGTVAGTDPDAGNVLSYTLADDAGGRFAINASSGVVTVANSALLDFTAGISRQIVVRTTDQGGLTLDKSFTITVTAANHTPTDATLSGASVAENAANGTTVGTITGIDPDSWGTLSYSLTDNAGGRFAVNATTGVVTVANGSLLNYEAATSHNITVRVTDQGNLTFDKTLAIAVTNVNEAPTNATLSANSVAENAANGTAVGTVTGVDPDAGATFSYALTDNAGGRFAINATTGAITVANSSLLNYEAATSHNITVRVTDQGGLTFDKAFTVNVTNVNEAPTNATLSANSVAENAANGTAVGTVTGSDPDAGATFSYSLTDNAGGRFAVNATTGAITVANGSLLNYEAATSHSITVRVTDQGGLTFDKAFTVNLTNVNEAPTNATLSANTVAENAANGTAVGTVTGIDPDAGATFSYALTDNAGGRFAVNATTGAVTVANGSLLNYEAATSHNITARVTDQGGLTFDKTFSITVTNVVGLTVTGTAGADVLNGSSEEDTIQGLAGNDTLIGGAVGDVLDGGAGFDTASYANAAAGVTASLASAAANTGDAAGDSYTSIEALIGSNFADTLTGDGGDNKLQGGGGNDIINGGAGNDTAVYSGRRANYTISYSAGAFTVVDVRGGTPDGTDTLSQVETIQFTDGSSTYDSAGRLTTQTFIDVDNLYGWATDIAYYDTAGHLTSEQGTNDTGDTWTVLYDVAGTQPWSLKVLSYDLSARLVQTRYDNDDGTHWIDQFDAAGTQPWSLLHNVYDSAWRQIALGSVADNGVLTNTSYDPLNQNNWTTLVQQFDTSSRMFQQDVYYDVGTHLITYWDYSGAQVWWIENLMYDQYGRLTRAWGDYDDGTHWDNLWDTFNQQSWSANFSTYDSSWRLIHNSVWADNGYLTDAFYDQSNQTWWWYYYNVYTPDGLFLTQHGIRDDGSTWPVVLDLDGNGVDITPLAASTARFDMDGDGRRDHTAWAGPNDGLLAIDLGGNGASGPDGVIDQTKEIVFTQWAPGTTSDMAALRQAFDTNGNGRLDQGDARWSEFRIWQDADGDGISQPSELTSLGDRGILSIDLNPVGPAQILSDGSKIEGLSTYTKSDGSSGFAGDVALAGEGQEWNTLAGPNALARSYWAGDASASSDYADVARLVQALATHSADSSGFDAMPALNVPRDATPQINIAAALHG